MSPEVCFVMVVAAVAAALFFRSNNGSLSVEVQQSIRVILENEICVEKNGKHLYKSKTGKYVVLDFSATEGGRHYLEESFDTADEAIASFFGDK